MIIRDDVWNEVLTEITQEGVIKKSELSFNEGKKYTVRRTLKQMEQSGWLRRESEYDSTWRLGEKAEDYLNVSRETIQNARESDDEE